MIEGIPKISVLIICYKQEELIKRAINSLLAQKEYIYEICVSDDCSPDNTWQVLLDYQRQYPDLLKLNRNESNIGIFENIEKSWTMPSGDIVYQLSGDDECPQDWFKTVIDYIQDNKLNCQNDRFAIYGNYEASYPNGDSYIFSNGAITTGIDPVRLSIRGIIGNRSAVCSRKVVESYKLVSQGKSHIAESAIDRQQPFFADKVYYIPQVGNIYYTRIGVSANLDAEMLKEREDIETYAMQVLQEQGYQPDKKDLAYVQLQSERAKSYRIKSFSHFVKKTRLWFASFDPKVSFKAFRIKRYIFAIRIRLPHTKPIKMII